VRFGPYPVCGENPEFSKPDLGRESCCETAGTGSGLSGSLINLLVQVAPTILLSTVGKHSSRDDRSHEYLISRREENVTI